MEINIDSKKQIVEFWLSQKEQNDTALVERLKPQYKYYAEQKYFVAVFHSGTCDLCQATAALLCHNRKRLAQREVRLQHRQGIPQECGGKLEV